MSYQPNNNKALGKLVAWGAIAAVALVVYVASSRQADNTIGPSEMANRAAGGRNPILATLEPSFKEATASGVGVVILVDASGSMGDTVKGANGRPEQKIAIARSCAMNLVQQVQKFTQQHPDNKVLMGVRAFNNNSTRVLVPLGPPNADIAAAGIASLDASGDTPIGDAMIAAAKDLGASGLTRTHILVITDGENTAGYNPADVADAISRLNEDRRPAMYFVAFDTSAKPFAPLVNSGAAVLSASNGPELQTRLDALLTGKILVEAPEPAKAK